MTDEATTELQTPLIDEWMTKWPSTHDYATIDMRFPTSLWVDIQPFGQSPMATLRIGRLTIMHKPDDMRLLLQAALEWLDIREADLAAGRES